MQLCQLGAGVAEHSVEVWFEEQQLLAQLLPPLLEALLLRLGLPAVQQAPNVSTSLAVDSCVFVSVLVACARYGARHVTCMACQVQAELKLHKGKMA